MDSFPNNHDPEEGTSEHGGLIPYLYGLNESAKSYCPSLEKANYSSWAATASTFMTSYADIVTGPLWSLVVTPPCCDTFCDIGVSAAQLLYWPTPAPVPAVTTVVGSDGFTL